MPTKTIIAIGFAVCVAAGAGIALLLQDINKHQFEAGQTFFKVAEVDEKTTDPAIWGRNFPRQYDTYQRTVDMEHTRFGGSEADPASPGKTTSRIEADPRLKTMWAGYAFAVDFREERGHAYMLQDQRETGRQQAAAQPGACLHCHASTTVVFRDAGRKAGAAGTGDEPLLSPAGLAQLQKGFEVVCALPYAEAAKLADHPVTCIDCHDPGSMNLRITRPGFLNGVQALAASTDPVPHLASIERWRKGNRQKPYDPNHEATRQEMRSFVCAQCHVEYYFKGDGKRLTFPWHNGLKMEQILAYYDEPKFKDGLPHQDWTHQRTGAPALKAQHPEFETWSQGTHARAGVACADCHMPYVRDGAVKVSSHQVRSPLLDVAKACQTCHRTSEDELKTRVATIQERTERLMNRGLDALCALVADLEAARAAGYGDADLAPARQAQRQAGWRIDFVNAENSMGFHAAQESARILGEACDLARLGQVRLLELRLAKPPPAKPAAPP